MSKIVKFPTKDQQLREITENLFNKIDHWFENDEIKLCVRKEIIPIFDELLPKLIGKLPKPIKFPDLIPKKEILSIIKQYENSYTPFHYQFLKDIFGKMVRLQIKICTLEREQENYESEP